jgi:ketosteroid isomerase-like protein
MGTDPANSQGKTAMKKIVLTAAMALLGGGALAATPGETVSAFHAAIGAGDKNKALALISPTITIYESGHVERSREEYANHHLASDMAFAKAVTRKVLKHTERVDGNIATVLEETETTGDFKGKPVHSFGVETAVLEKRGDGWVIVHVHWSSRKAK